MGANAFVVNVTEKRGVMNILECLSDVSEIGVAGGSFIIYVGC